MSFIAKGLKKVWKFVKDNWVKIALAAAVVFTAGVATVGFGAFAAAGFGPGAAVAGTAAGNAAIAGGAVAAGSGTVGGFMGAVGSTMWAGVTGAAGSMGIGSGASVPTTTGTIAAGTAGGKVGLGAAWGAGASLPGGSSLGWDATGKLSANMLESMSSNMYNSAVAQGMSKEAAKKGVEAFAKDFTTMGTKEGLSKLGTKAVQYGAKEGMTTAQATLISSGMGALGPALVGLAGEEGDEGGAPIWGSTAGGKRNEAKAQVAAPEAPGVVAPDSPGAADPAGAGTAQYMVGRQMDRPLMGAKGGVGLDGRPIQGEEVDPWEEGLMNRTGRYAYG